MEKFNLGTRMEPLGAMMGTSWKEMLGLSIVRPRDWRIEVGEGDGVEVEVEVETRVLE